MTSADVRDCSSCVDIVVPMGNVNCGLDAGSVEKSRPPCCPADSIGYLAPSASYEEKGVVDTLIGGLQCYVAETSAATKGVIIVAYDIFGFTAGRTRQICDELAAQGFTVLLPDFFRGGGGNPDVWVPFAVPSMIRSIKATRWEQVAVDLEAVVSRGAELGGASAAAGSDSAVSVGFVGFCWGGWVAARACASGLFDRSDVTVVGAALVHPSLRVEGMAGSGLSELDIATDARCPMLLLPSASEPASVKEGGSFTTALAAKHPATKAKTYGGMKHGWVPRGDLRHAAVQRAASDAMAEIVAFFNARCGVAAAADAGADAVAA